MTSTNQLIVLLAVVQVMIAFTLGQDILPIVPWVKYALAVVNTGLVFWLANTKAWDDTRPSDPKPHG